MIGFSNGFVPFQVIICQYVPQWLFILVFYPVRAVSSIICSIPFLFDNITTWSFNNNGNNP